MFHAKDGLFFERLADGEVRVIKTWDGREPREDNIACDVALTPGSFASVVASMSARGETGATYREALALLQKLELLDCPHASPFRYCAHCVADPCPIGMDKIRKGSGGG